MSVFSVLIPCSMPIGHGYSVEAQLTGEEVVGGLQFEITPALCK